MDVFISWSGDRSRAVAELLDEWLQCVLQAAKPWTSSRYIDRGSIWFSEISKKLNDTKIGIVCLTKDNLEKPWILFEAGALAKGISSQRVCTLLIDLNPTDISDPLAQFNHTMPDKAGIFSLVSTLNSELGERSLSDKVLDEVFKTYWENFEDRFKKILKDYPEDKAIPKRTEGDVLSDILRTVRTLDKRLHEIEYSSHQNIPEYRYRENLDLKINQNEMVERIYELANHGFSRIEIHNMFGSKIPEDIIDNVLANMDLEKINKRK